jgi:hypothetical protein
MVMTLFRGMCHSDPQYLTVSVREVKYTCLRYRTRLSRLHTLDPPPPNLALAFSRSSHSATLDPEEENNQDTPDKSQVSQADPPTIGLHNLN